MYLGIDIGTSAVKSIVTDDSQAVLASASAALGTSRPRALWSEQDPDDWWRAVSQTVAELRHQLGTRWQGVRAIGLSGQMHSAVLLDKAGTPLRPAILWNDGRSHGEARDLQNSAPDIGTIAGVPAMPSFTAPKLIWLNRHEPDVMRQTAHICLAKDYVRWRMTGQFVTDMCDAAGSLLLDEAARAWSPDIVHACGITEGQLPKLKEGSEASGQLMATVAADWGLAPGLVVAAGAGDAAAGAVGIGAINEGDAFISLGTSAQYFITRESYVPAPDHLIHTFCHALPGRWFQMAAILNGASSLAWAAAMLGEPDVGKLLAEVEEKYSGPSPMLFLPYLSGERTPLNDAHAKGVIFGLTPSMGRNEVMQAVLEGVTMTLSDCQTYLAETGPLPERLGVIGGGAKSPFWMKLLASAIGRTVVLYEGGETGPAFGAARLARLALTGEAAASVCTKPAEIAAFAPDPALQAAYADKLVAFRSLYQRLKPAFAAG